MAYFKNSYICDMYNKVVHLHFHYPPNRNMDFADLYFVSIAAIYDHVSVDDMGIRRSSLTEALRRNHVYRNKQVVVRVGKLLRKPQCNPKAKG